MSNSRQAKKSPLYCYRGRTGENFPSEEKANEQQRKALAHPLTFSIHCAHVFNNTYRAGVNARMLEHLIDFDPEVGTHPSNAVPVEKASAVEAVDAKLKTTEWLEKLGAVDVDQVTTRLETEAARQAFNSVVTAAPEDHTHHQLAEIKTPEAVRHLVGMLVAYDWEFVQQAKELRGYTVAKLVEETSHPNANIRLKALALLGKVSEVGLFTEKVEIKKTDLSEEEIDKKLKDKLARFMNVSDAEITEIDVKNQPELSETSPTDDNQPSADA